MNISVFHESKNYFCFTAVETDPFLENETDPLKTNAIESSLWELETLQQHVLPKVSKTVSFINKPLPTVEWDLTELFDNTYDQVGISKLNVLIFYFCSHKTKKHRA